GRQSALPAVAPFLFDIVSVRAELILISLVLVFVRAEFIRIILILLRGHIILIVHTLVLLHGCVGLVIHALVVQALIIGLGRGNTGSSQCHHAGCDQRSQKRFREYMRGVHSKAPCDLGYKQSERNAPNSSSALLSWRLAGDASSGYPFELSCHLMIETVKNLQLFVSALIFRSSRASGDPVPQAGMPVSGQSPPALPGARKRRHGRRSCASSAAAGCGRFSMPASEPPISPAPSR